MYVAALMAQLLVWLLVVTHLIYRPSFSIYHPAALYSCFHFLVFVLRPILAYAYGYDDGLYRAYGFVPNDADKIMVLVITTVGFVVFTAMSIYYGRSEVRFLSAEKVEYERNHLRKAFFITLLCLAPLAWYSIGVSFSGNVDRIVDPATGHIINVQGNGYATDAQLMAVSLCALFAWIMRFRLIAIIPVMGIVGVRAGLGSRGPMVAILAMVTLLYAYEKRVRRPTFKVLAVFVLAAAIFRMVGDDREGLTRMLTQPAPTTEMAASDEGRGPLESMDYANSVFMEYLVGVVPERSGGYNYFMDIMEVFTAPIPRAWWSGKPAGSPVVLVNLFDYGTPIGMTISLPGEGWYSLGWLGVILWCGLWGALLGRWYERFASGQQSIYATLAYLTFFPVLIIGYRDGVLMSVLKQAFWYLTPVLLWYFFARKVLLVPSFETFWRRKAVLQAAGENSSTTGPAGALRTSLQAALPPAVLRRRRALASTAPER